MHGGRLKLADFGFCKQLARRNASTRTFCGTLEYIAPEIYQHIPYSFPVDCWSLGVMIFEMLVLKTPFYHSSEMEIKSRIMSGEFQIPKHASSDLHALLTSLLQKDPTERLKIHELRSHNFYSPPYSLDDLEQSRVQCPWKRVVNCLFSSSCTEWLFSFQKIPLNIGHDKYDSTSRVCLSDIDEQAICTTHTVNKDKFRQFSFMAF